MCSRFFLATLLVAGLTCTAPLASARSGDAPTRNTEAPGHDSCANCHGGSGNGSIDLSFSGGGSYIPGELYDLLVTVEDPGQSRFGFAMVARDADSPFTDVGSWTSETADTGVSGREVGHRDAPFDTDDGVADNSHTFAVKWTAPAAGAGDVTFYVIGNAANGNGRTSGDFVYVKQVTITEQVAMSNQPPEVSAPEVVVEVASGSAVPVTGIALSDPDAGSGELTVQLTVQEGLLRIADTVDGGVGAVAISNNGSGTVTVTGPLAQLNATFGDPNGLIYEAPADFGGADTLAINANDNGNTGTGGAMSGSGSVALLVILPPRVELSGFLPDGSFQFTLLATDGITYLVEHTEDLENWSLQEEITLAGSSAVITDSNAPSATSRFYRARRKP